MVQEDGSLSNHEAEQITDEVFKPGNLVYGMSTGSFSDEELAAFLKEGIKPGAIVGKRSYRFSPLLPWVAVGMMGHWSTVCERYSNTAHDGPLTVDNRPGKIAIILDRDKLLASFPQEGEVVAVGSFFQAPTALLLRDIYPVQDGSIFGIRIASATETDRDFFDGIAEPYIQEVRIKTQAGRTIDSSVWAGLVVCRQNYDQISGIVRSFDDYPQLPVFSPDIRFLGYTQNRVGRPDSFA